MESLVLAVTMACALGTSTPVRAADRSKAAETRAEYVKKAHAELDEISAKIDALEIKAQDAGTSVKEGLDKKLTALKARRKTAKRDFARLKHASGKAWRRFKIGVDMGIEELKAGYDEAVKKI